MWTSTDCKNQLLDPYGYSPNPTNTVDPNGEYILGAVLGALMMGYINGVASNAMYATLGGGNPLNPADWNWHDPMMMFGLGMSMVQGGVLGSAFENHLWHSYWSGGGQFGLHSDYGIGVRGQLFAAGCYTPPDIVLREEAKVNWGKFANEKAATVDELKRKYPESYQAYLKLEGSPLRYDVESYGAGFEAEGSYTTGGFQSSPTGGKLYVSGDYFLSTLRHEMSHALDRELLYEAMASPVGGYSRAAGVSSHYLYRSQYFDFGIFMAGEQRAVSAAGENWPALQDNYRTTWMERTGETP